jgi:hypothetical protein
MEDKQIPISGTNSNITSKHNSPTSNTSKRVTFHNEVEVF